MIIQLDRVVFDHAPGVGVNDALSIRVDRTTTAPDWIRGASGTSYAAYAIVPTLDQHISIQADFSFPDPLLAAAAPVDVRARAVDPNDRVLGHLAPSAVQPGAGRVAFDLEDTQIWERGVGKYAVSWQWQFRLGAGGPWVDFDRSDHAVYVTLDVPGIPWTQGVSPADQLVWPWTRVLDWACAWGADVRLTSSGASGAAKKLMARLEAGLFAQGHRDLVPLQYRFAGDATYTQEFPSRVFFCSAFLDLLDGMPSSDFGNQVNCSDCAAALATFGNALGCGVLQKRVTHENDSMLRTNRIVLIGESEDSPETHWFAFHEFVVRLRPSDHATLVHDATLMVDADEDPTRTDEDHDFDLAEGMQLGEFVDNPSSFRYAHRLIGPEQWDAGVLEDVGFRCIDDCVGQANPPDRMAVRRYQIIRGEIERLAPAGAAFGPADLTPPAIPGLTLYDRIVNPLQIATMRPLVKRSVEFFYVAPGNNARARGRRLRLLFADCGTGPNARDALGWLLAQNQARVSQMPDAAAGVDYIAFRTRRDAGLFMVAGNTLVRVVNVGRTAVPLKGMLQLLRGRLQPRSHLPSGRTRARENKVATRRSTETST